MGKYTGRVFREGCKNKNSKAYTRMDQGCPMEDSHTKKHRKIDHEALEHAFNLNS